jgi:threonine dehydrogenase-like Zn-dependent dehydrogenase
MKQVIQSFKTGELSIADIPAPGVRSRGILVKTGASLVSAGTERMVAEFAEKSLLQKAQSRPDLVKQVVEKVQREGLITTLESVQSKLDQPLPLGYSSAGIILEAGLEAGGFKIGDRVACAGGGYASHAEIAYVPRNLAVKLPDDVSFEAAAFATIGAIALQGIRQAEVTLGHHVAVIGLGLLGQLTIQMLKAAGCKVYGMDINPSRAALAQQLGADAVATDADTMMSLVQGQSLGRGADVVLITADTRRSHWLVN